jgi:hypothetical protein
MNIKSLLINQQQPILLLIGYILIAGLAFSLGRLTGPSTPPPEIVVEEAFVPLNNTLENSIGQSQTEPVLTPTPAAGGTQSGGNDSDCAVGQIKGNIGSGNSRVYHLPGGSFYNRTEAEMCFNTEAEALAAGFRKSTR